MLQRLNEAFAGGYGFLDAVLWDYREGQFDDDTQATNLVAQRRLAKMHRKTTKTLAEKGFWRKKTPAGLVWHNRRKVEAAGIEREEPSRERPIQQGFLESAEDVSPLCLHTVGIDQQQSAFDDVVLQRVIRCWPSLSGETKLSIDAMVIEAVLFGD